MASIDYVQYEKTETGKRIHHAEDAEQANKKLYRPITRHLGDRLVIIEADDQATTLLLETTIADVQVQLLHASQVEAMSEGETREWQILHGNFVTDVVTEEYLENETEPSVVAARLLAIVGEYDNPTPVKAKRTTSTAKMPRKTSAKVEAEPEAAPKKARMPRKATAKVEEVAPPAAKKTTSAKLPVKGKLPVKKSVAK